MSVPKNDNEPAPYNAALFPRYDTCGKGVDDGCGKAHLRIDEDDRYCAACRVSRDLPPLSLPILPPWYETIGDEELARIRAAPWTATTFVEGEDGKLIQKFNTRTQREEARGADVTLPQLQMPHDWTKPTVVNMTYRKTDGSGTISLMAGKTIPHPVFGMVFYHAAGDEESEGQAHQVTDSPCPVDVLLATKLAEAKVGQFYAYDRIGKILYRAAVQDIMKAPTAVYAKRTTRERYFLPLDEWQSLAGVDERLQPDRRTRVLMRGDRIILTVPFINTEITLGMEVVF